MATIPGLFARGTAAARPASASPGAHYFATDTELLYRWSGSSWEAMSVGFPISTAKGGSGVDIASATLTVGSGQIGFPGVQNPSANANVLDDYEEGTWTVQVGGAGGQSGQAYSSQVATYVKIGQMVLVSFAVTLSTLGTITGQVQIQGLPFTTQNLSGARFVCPVFWSSLTTAYVLVQGVALENVSAIGLNGATAATTSMSAVTLAQADLTATSRFVGTLIYRAGA